MTTRNETRADGRCRECRGRGEEHKLDCSIGRSDRVTVPLSQLARAQGNDSFEVHPLILGESAQFRRPAP